MLRSIRIKDFALIHQLEIEFAEGLTVFSGETGAGKSVLIDAVNMIMGGRASADYIRSSCERFMLDASFDLPQNNHELNEKLSDYGVEAEDDVLIISREYNNASRNNCRINGRPVTLGQLRAVTEMLVEIHGQNENQRLLSPAVQLDLLDEFAGTDAFTIKTQLADIVGELKHVAARREEFGGDEADRARKVDFAKFELDEISTAGISEREELQLREERDKLANYARIMSSVTEAYGLLDNADDTMSLQGVLTKCAALLEHAAQHDQYLRKYSDNLAAAVEMAADTALGLSDYLEGADYDPKRLEIIDDRLYRYAELKRKYGETVQDILVYAQSRQDFLDSQASAEKTIKDLDDQEAQLIAYYEKLAVQLRILRKDAAAEIENRITGELGDLSMRGARFHIEFSEIAGIAKNGTDAVEYMVATNPGEAMKNMAKIASGGEISRIMLALRVILAGVGNIDTMIFDEVDTGIGGRTAQAVAEKLQLISRGRQVFCVTHSPQIAAFADNHIGIKKVETDDTVKIMAEKLAEEARKREIARMIAGTQITEMSLLHAGEMLQLAAEKK